MESDQSAINNLNIQLGYTTVEAPIDGRTGNITQKAGNIITAGTTDLAIINQVEPIYVTFAVPEARLGDVKTVFATAASLQVTARAQDGSGDIESGQLTFIDNTVDTSTGTIKLKGTFKNTAHKLWPGQFVIVALAADHCAQCGGSSESSGADGPGRNLRLCRERRPDCIGSPGKTGDHVWIRTW